MGAIKAAIGDAVLTFMWAFCASSLGALTSVIATALGVQGLLWPSLFITTLLFFVLLFVFTLIGDALLGGASFNPTGNASFYAAGLGSDTLFSMALRFPAQAAGAVGGTLAIMEIMPKEYKHILGGPSLKVDLHSGAIAEGLLTFLMSFAVLLIIFRGPRSLIMKTWFLAVAAVSLIFVGSNYTGPAMNPTFAFGWAYVDKSHDTWEHFYVYWICPFIGAILAAWIFRLLFPTSTQPAKQKKA